MGETTKPSATVFQTFVSLHGTSRDKLADNGKFRITSMSSIEVSLMVPDYKRAGNVERVSPRPQRPPPPPPSQSPNEQTAKPSERMSPLLHFIVSLVGLSIAETPSPLQETPTDSIPKQDKPVTTLL
jgi:hypothetical protein